MYVMMVNSLSPSASEFIYIVREKAFTFGYDQTILVISGLTSVLFESTRTSAILHHLV